MKARPILFSGPMVRAILDGTKTQTRRVVKHKPDADCPYHENNIAVACPYGKVGDRLWVRETWKPHYDCMVGTCIRFRADDLNWKPTAWTHDQGGWCELNEETPQWRPSIFMPRWASRLTLEITAVRVERLQAITEADAKAEGVEWLNQGYRIYGREACTYSAIQSYRTLWESINGFGSWDTNPWVWVIEFKRL